MVYVGGLLSFAVQLRVVGSENVGLWALVSLIAVVKMNDIGAYTVGRIFGRHKLAPKLSPGKTWEGVAGGVLFASGTAYFIFAWLVPVAEGSPSWGWLAYGILLAAVGTVGDLAESLLKREAGRKDSSTWMPGFGGVMDLLDSLLAAAPVAYGCWVAGLFGR